MTEEVWKDIPGYEGRYQASSLGRIRSFCRYPAGKIIRPGTNRRGYKSVVLRLNGKSITREVHTLIAAAFLGPRPNENQIRHLDGNRKNNAVVNLAYGTRSENQLDLYDYRGYHHKLTAEDVLNIRRRLSAGETGRSIAIDFGISESNVSCIKHGGTYAWL